MLHVEEHGEGEPLLLIEGLGQGMWAWREQIPVFAQRFRTIGYDARGTGRSPRPTESYGLDDLADDAATILEGRRAHAVGFSMGGYTALTLALAHPELVRSLVLVSTGAGGSTRVPRAEEVREAYKTAIRLPYDEYARATMPLEFSPGWTDRHPARFDEVLGLRLARPAGHETLDAHLRVCWEHYNRGCPVERIGAPALVIHGSADLVVPVENGRMLAARLPNAEYVELDGIGHNVQLEVPGTFNELVLQFLARA